MAFAQLSYDPWEIPPEERKARLVGREGLLKQILNAVSEQEGRKTLQHYLLLGPRGIGKTTLLLTIRDRIHENPELAKRWICVQLREEEYFVRTLRDLLELVLRSLAEDEDVSGAAELAERMRAERNEGRSLAIAVDGLRELTTCHDRRILLLIDNFDRIFPTTASGRGKKRKPETPFRAFRKLLSTEGFLMVVGSSVRLFEEIAAYDQAFFNFFCPIEVPNLSDDEICQLLRKCAEAEQAATFLDHFDEMRNKVRAITYMTGGNPRLVLMLYDVLRHREMLPVVQTLRETVVGLTPLLKHVLDDMPSQQSKTLDALVRLQGAASPSVIAELTRLPLNVVTVQLGRLRESRFVRVEGSGRGKAATYRITDPMFHTWYQMRYLRPARRRIELFVEFIRAWFSVEERREFLEQQWCKLNSIGKEQRAFKRSREALLNIEYYAATLDDEKEREQHFGRLADVWARSGKYREAALVLIETLGSALLTEVQAESVGYSLLGMRLSNQGNLTEARKAFHAALKEDPTNAGASLGLAIADYGLGDREGAFHDYTVVIDRPGAPSSAVAIALVGRSILLMQLGNLEMMHRDIQRALEIGDIPPEVKSWVLFACGIGMIVLQRNEEAVACYQQCLKLKAEMTSANMAFMMLIFLYTAKAQWDEAARSIAELHQFELEGTPTEVRLSVRINTITAVGKNTSLDAAALLLRAALDNDPEEIRERLAFLSPAIEYAKTNDEKVLSKLPDPERDMAKQIAATLKSKPA